jgi:hypothetical protein
MEVSDTLTYVIVLIAALIFIHQVSVLIRPTVLDTPWINPGSTGLPPCCSSFVRGRLRATFQPQTAGIS